MFKNYKRKPTFKISAFSGTKLHNILSILKGARLCKYKSNLAFFICGIYILKKMKKKNERKKRNKILHKKHCFCLKKKIVVWVRVSKAHCLDQMAWKIYIFSLGIDKKTLWHVFRYSKVSGNWINFPSLRNNSAKTLCKINQNSRSKHYSST